MDYDKIVLECLGDCDDCKVYLECQYQTAPDKDKKEWLEKLHARDEELRRKAEEEALQAEETAEAETEEVESEPIEEVIEEPVAEEIQSEEVIEEPVAEEIQSEEVIEEIEETVVEETPEEEISETPIEENAESSEEITNEPSNGEISESLEEEITATVDGETENADEPIDEEYTLNEETAVEETPQEEVSNEEVAEEIVSEEVTEETVQEEIDEEPIAEEIASEEVIEEVEETAVEETPQETVEETIAVEEVIKEEPSSNEGENEEKEEVEAEEKPEGKPTFKLTPPENNEELMANMCAKRGRKLIYRPQEALISLTFKVIGTDKKNDIGEKVKDILDAEIKQGTKLGYLDKFDGLKSSEIKEEYEDDIVYEYADQEFKKTGVIYDGKDIKVYLYDWDLKACHHVGKINVDEAQEIVPYLLDKDKYSFDVCGIITGGKGKRVIKEGDSLKIVKEKGDPVGLDVDITVIPRKD